jgi:N utilization substance protein A
MNKEFIDALEEIEEKKHIPKAKVLESLKRALESAFKKNYEKRDKELNLSVEIDEKTGEIIIYNAKMVVEEVYDEDMEVSLEDAKALDPEYEIGDEAEFPYVTDDFGRIAAQTAKNVVINALRKEEQDIIYDAYKDSEGEIVNGSILRLAGPTVYVMLGEVEAVMPKAERVFQERLRKKMRLKFLVTEVKNEERGVMIILSRGRPEFIIKLFELEVPELQDGTIEVVRIAREAGDRTKMAVRSNNEEIDPVGTCIGNRGIRVGAVVDETFGEKIDVIPWSEDMTENVKAALGPAKCELVEIDEDGNATAVVPDYQYSLAIGRDGQNVRIAVRLLDISIDIKTHSEYYGEEETPTTDEPAETAGDAPAASPEPTHPDAATPIPVPDGQKPDINEASEKSVDAPDAEGDVPAPSDEPTPSNDNSNEEEKT